MSRSGFKNIELIKASAIYSKLKKEVTEAGILDRAYGYYAFSFVFTLSGFISSLFAIYYSQSAIFLSLSCISLAIFTVQMAGLMHDGSHRAVFKSALANDVLGYFATSIFGYAYSKWYVTHNMHHASPNRENEDPDMNRPFLAFSEEEAKSKKGISRFLIKYQTLTYLPIISTSALYMQLSGFFYFITDFKLRRLWEFAIYTLSIFTWLIVPWLIFTPEKVLLIFLFFYPLVGIYTFNLFAPNHKGMPRLKEGTKLSFLEQQIITSRNIKGSPILDFFMLSLNYQIEHHLFPNCPRNKLKLISPYVKKLCQENHLDYTEVSFIKTNKIILSELRKVAVSV